MRTTYVLRDGELVEKHLAEPLHEAHGAGPYVISDSMNPIRSMADGRVHDSKSRYLQGVRDAGCRVVGNDRLDRTITSAPRAGADIKRAIQQLS